MITKDEKVTIETIEPQTVSRYVFEATVASHERVKKALIKALVTVFLVLTIALVGTNGYWIYNASQYDRIDYEYTQDGKGTNIIGNSNEVNQNGTETPYSLGSETERQNARNSY